MSLTMEHLADVRMRAEKYGYTCDPTPYLDDIYNGRKRIARLGHDLDEARTAVGDWETECNRLKTELAATKERLQGSREHVEEEHRKVVNFSAEIRKLLDERDSRQAALAAIPKPSKTRLTVRVLADGHVCLTMPMRHARVLTGYLAEPVVAAKYPRTDDVPSDILYTLEGVSSMAPEPPSTPDTAAATETTTPVELVYCTNCPDVAMPITASIHACPECKGTIAIDIYAGLIDAEPIDLDELKQQAEAVAPGVTDQLHNLLGCAYGTTIVNIEHPGEPCTAKADQVVVLHNNGQQAAFKLCKPHAELIKAETTPRAADDGQAHAEPPWCCAKCRKPYDGASESTEPFAAICRHVAEGGGIRVATIRDHTGGADQRFCGNPDCRTMLAEICGSCWDNLYDGVPVGAWFPWQLQPDGTYEPVERSPGPTTYCGCGLPIGHEGECYL